MRPAQPACRIFKDVQKSLKLLFIGLILNLYFGYSQNVAEVSKPDNLVFIDSVFTELKSIAGSSLDIPIQILENALKQAKTNYEIHKITYNLGSLYTQTNQLDKCIDMWEAAISRGICYNYELGEKPFPSYLASYRGNDRFSKFMELNDSIKQELSKDSIAEYFVSVPNGYDGSWRYPVIIIMHGGYGNYYNTFEDWQSETLTSDFIAVYTQGRIFRDSFYRSYGDYGVEDITEIYQQVTKNYSVDTTAVILAGQSAGGALSLSLVDRKIQSTGLLLAFPVKPTGFDISEAKRLKNSSTRVFMICGEQDKSFYPGQIELSSLLDRAQVENRIITYPDLGHAFPDDFSSQIDAGLNYLLGKIPN